MPARAHAAMLVPALLFSGALAFQRPGTTLLDTAVASSVCIMHLATAYLASAKRHNAAGVMAYANWALKFLYWSWYILPGAHTPWLGLASNYTVYGLGACSALMDFYQLQLGGRLHPALLAVLSSCHAMCLAGFTLAVRHRSGLTTDSWLNTCALLILGMVAGPRIADTLLLMLIKHVKWTRGQTCPDHPALAPAVAAVSAGAVKPKCTSDPAGHDQAEECRTCPAPALHSQYPCQPGMCSPPTASRRRPMHHAPGFFDSAMTSALRGAQSQQYVSKLGFVTKVCVKVRTHQAVTDVNPELATQLQAALANIGYPRHHLLDIAARPGCIALTLDVLQETIDAEQPYADMMKMVHPTQQAHMLAAQLLPTLTALLPYINVHDGYTAPVTFSVGNVVLQAQLQAGQWVLQAALDSTSTASKAATPAYILAAAQQLHSHSIPASRFSRALSALRSCIGLATAHDFLPAPIPTTSTSTSGSSTAAVHVVSLQACMLPLNGISAGKAYEAHGEAPGVVAWWAASEVVGWQPATAGRHEGAAASNSFRLLARCEGSYLATTIHSHDDSDAEGGDRFLQVDVSIPDALLLRHHTSGPSVGLLPVVMELWQGLCLITSTSALLQVPSCSTCTTNPVPTVAVSTKHMLDTVSAPAAHALYAAVRDVHACSRTGGGIQAPKAGLLRFATSTGQQPAVTGQFLGITGDSKQGVWWWGTDSDTASQAVQELHRHGTQMQKAALSAGNPEVLATWNAFTADVNIWLNHIRLISASTGQCMCSSPNARPLKCTQMPSLPVSPAVLVELGADLAAYAQAVGLQQVAKMITQQQVVARMWQQQTAFDSLPMPAESSHNMCLSGAGLLHILKASVVGFPCPMCEAHCRECMATQLAAVQMYSSMAFSGMGAASIIRAWVQKGSNLIWLPWTLGHTLIWSRAWLAGSPPQSHQPSSRNSHTYPTPVRLQPAPVSATRTASQTPGRPVGRTLTLLVMMCHLIPYVLNGAGWVPMSASFELLINTRVVLVVSLLVALGELLQLAAFLPAPCVLFVTSLDAACYMMVAAHAGRASPQLIAGLLITNVLSVLLMTVHLRLVITNTWAAKSALSHVLMQLEEDNHSETGHGKANSPKHAKGD